MREARTGKKFQLRFKQGTPPCFFISFLGRAPTVHLGAIFIIHQAPAFCQEEISTKINEKIFLQLYILTIVFYSWMWYYNNCQEGKAITGKTSPPHLKKSVKSLLTTSFLYDIINTSNEGVAQLVEQQPFKLLVRGSNPLTLTKKFLKEIKKKCLTNQVKCATIRM